MKKILLLLTALFVVGGVEVYARDISAALASGVSSGTATWTADEDGYKCEWTGPESYISLFNAFGGQNGGELDWSTGTNFVFTCSGPTSSETNALNVVIVANGKNFSRAMYSDGTKTLTLTATSGDGFKHDGWSDYITSADLKHVTDVRLQAVAKHGMTLTESGAFTVTNVFVQLSPMAEVDFAATGVASFSLSDIDVTGTGVSYDASTGVVTSTGNSGAFLLNLNNVDFSNVKRIDVDATISGTEGEVTYSDIINTCAIIKADGNVVNTWYSSRYGIDFTSYQASAGSVKEIRWNVSAAGTMKINSITITADVISCSVPRAEVPLNELPWKILGGSGTAIPDWNMNTSTDTYYGNYSGDPTHYVDLTGYSELRVYPNSEEGFRAFFINAEGTATTQINNNAAVWNSEGNYWSLDLSEITKYNDMVALKAIKSPQSGQKGIIKNIVAYKDWGTNAPQYILKGWGVLSTSVAEALADASAKVIDATGVTGTNVALESANPNCIFLANAGTLSNTKNVQIGNEIEYLEITDKKPLADLTGVTATAATYTRSMTNQFGTICLPYAVTSTESVKYYTIDNLDGDVLMLTEETELAAGTPAIVEKVSGESIIAKGSGALAAAGAPTDNLELIGTFEEKTVLAADYADKNIYAIKNNQFVQGLNSITVPAFRAYFTADASAEANLRLAFGDEATAIDSLTGEKSIKAIYSVSGASQASLQKGMNIVEFTDGSVKKVMVK